MSGARAKFLKLKLVKSNIKKARVEADSEVMNVDCKSAIDKLKTRGESCDLIFMDPPYYENLFVSTLEKISDTKLLNEDGIIIADNVLFKGRVLGEYNEHKHRTAVNRLREYLKTIKEDERLDSSLVDIGDGIAISVVK